MLPGAQMLWLASAIARVKSGASALHTGRVPQAMPWAHLDVYAWNDNDRPGRPAGGEAQGLRAVYVMLRERFGT